MPYPPKYLQSHLFNEAALRAEDFDEGALDNELANIRTSLNLMNDRLRAISTANGRLKYDEVARYEFTATAGQTAFTIGSYIPNVDLVEAFTNGGSGNQDRIPTGLIDKTDTTTVTLPAQTLNATVSIIVKSPGNGNSALASTDPDNGAALVGVEDAGGIYDGTTVEECLAEVMGDLNTFIALIGTVTNYIKKDGSIDFTDDQSMGDNKLTNLAAATDAADAVRYDQLTAYTDIWNDLAARFLPLTGGTMSGDLEMGGNKIADLENGGTGTQEAATVAQVLELVGGTMAGDIDMDTNRILNLPAPTSDEEAVRKVDLNTLVPSLVTPPFANMQVFDGAGATTWTIPAGVTRLKAHVWGGGGGGGVGSSGADSTAGSGGGGGGYGEKILTVTAGHVLAVTIGAGGAAATDGGDSYIVNNNTSTELMRATGGGGSAGANTPGTGGGSSATLNVTGGKGGIGYNVDSSDTSIGGSGGAAGGGGGPGGGAGGYNGGGRHGGDGSVPGGGGGGGGGGAGVGGAGRVVVFY